MDKSLIRTFFDEYNSGGIAAGSSALFDKIVSVLFPISELCALIFVGYCGYRLSKGDSLKRHSVLISKRVSSEREKPRDIMRTHFFQNRQGLWIHHHLWWKHPDQKPKAIVVFLHGHSEHGKRYHHLADFLNNHGCAVFVMDHQGFGRSEGDRGHVEKFEDYVDDVLEFLELEVYNHHEIWKGIPRYIMGHSMGGLIALHVAKRCQDSKNPAHKLAGAILSSPALNLDPSRDTWYLRAIGAIIDKVFPKAALVSFPSHIATSFRQVQQHGKFDPLNYHGNVRVHQGLELVKGTKMAFDLAPEFSVPILIIHGVLDLHAGISGSRTFYSTIASKEKQMYELEGIYHQPLHEEKHIRDEVFLKVANWIESQNSSSK